MDRLAVLPLNCNEIQPRLDSAAHRLTASDEDARFAALLPASAPLAACGPTAAQSTLRKGEGTNMRTCAKLTMALSFGALLLILPPVCSADETVAVATLGALGQYCIQQTGGPGQPTATANCQFIGSGLNLSASGSVDLTTGATNAVAVSSDGGTGVSVNGSAGGSVPGAIGGTASGGTITLTDSGISWVTSGADGVGEVLLNIADVTTSAGILACDFTVAQPGCVTASSFSTTLPVANGDQIALDWGLACGASNNSTCSISDGITLALSPGLTFTPATPDFLSGSGGSPTPEPGTLLLFGTGLVGLAFLGKRRRAMRATALRG